MKNTTEVCQVMARKGQADFLDKVVTDRIRMTETFALDDLHIQKIAGRLRQQALFDAHIYAFRLTNSFNLALGHRGTIADAVTGMQNDLIAFSEPSQHLYNPVIAMAGLDNDCPCPPVLHGIGGPFIAFAEQGADRNREHIVSAPNRDMNDDAIIVPQPRPDLRWVDKIDHRVHTLLFDAEC